MRLRLRPTRARPPWLHERSWSSPWRRTLHREVYRRSRQLLPSNRPQLHRMRTCTQPCKMLQVRVLHQLDMRMAHHRSQVSTTNNMQCWAHTDITLGDGAGEPQGGQLSTAQPNMESGGNRLISYPSSPMPSASALPPEQGEDAALLHTAGNGEQGE